jgi:hypothetical protein
VAKRYLSPTRGKGKLARKAGARPTNPLTYIVGEGDCELVYFTALCRLLRLTSAHVVVAPNTEGPAPNSVVACAKGRAKGLQRDDLIYCVFDRDRHPTYANARQHLRDLNAREGNYPTFADAVSIPCWEIWVLLHFERSDAPDIECDNVIARVKVHMPDYEKTSRACAEHLVREVGRAVTNARWLEGRGVPNPATTVHRLVEHLQALAAGA